MFQTIVFVDEGSLEESLNQGLLFTETCFTSSDMTINPYTSQETWGDSFRLCNSAGKWIDLPLRPIYLTIYQRLRWYCGVAAGRTCWIWNSATRILHTHEQLLQIANFELCSVVLLVPNLYCWKFNRKISFLRHLSKAKQISKQFVMWIYRCCIKNFQKINFAKACKKAQIHFDDQCHSSFSFIPPF